MRFGREMSEYMLGESKSSINLRNGIRSTLPMFLRQVYEVDTVWIYELPLIFNIEHNILSVIRHEPIRSIRFDFTRENIKIICLIANKRGVRMKNRMKPFEFSNQSIAFVFHQCKSWLHFIIIAGKKWRELKCDIYMWCLVGLFKLTIYLNCVLEFKIIFQLSHLSREDFYLVLIRNSCINNQPTIYSEWSKVIFPKFYMLTKIQIQNSMFIFISEMVDHRSH